MAVGATGGVQYHGHAIALQLLWQSQNGNKTADFSGDARTFALLTWEYLGRPPKQKRDFFVRASGGMLLRDPWKTALALGGGAGVRYRVTSTMAFIASFSDVIAFLPVETLSVCPPPPATTCDNYLADDGAQHNFGLTMAFELRP